MIGIYRITNLINGKTYVGQSVNIEKRFWDHRCVSHESNKHLKYALMKYGKENFKYEVLEECSAEMLDEREIYYISTLAPEYNATSGGQGRGRHLSDDVKELLRQHGKKQWGLKSEEEKARIIRNNLLCGGKIGHPVSLETREKLRQRNLGKVQSKETIEKRRQTLLRKKANGYVFTGEGHKKRIVCIENGVEYESVKDAGRLLKIDASGISSVLRGRQKSTHGYHFEYLKV